jgi:mannose-6-phosphate isomerase-like protein (cupin superfamily)
MANLFTIAGGATIDLTALADELRAQISALPPGSPLLKAQELASQSGVQEYLVVVRGNEDPHIHPDGDLLITVLEGHGFLQLTGETVDAPKGSILVVTKGLCHAYYNKALSDSVLLATFSPKNSKAACPSTSA